jgi:hypothetical protein
MLSKKSPRGSCGIEKCNNRIEKSDSLNQRCALAPDLESILRAQTGKILFRQHRSQPVRLRASICFPVISESGHPGHPIGPGSARRFQSITEMMLQERQFTTLRLDAGFFEARQPGHGECPHIYFGARGVSDLGGSSGCLAPPDSAASRHR